MNMNTLHYNHEMNDHNQRRQARDHHHYQDHDQDVVRQHQPHLRSVAMVMPNRAPLIGETTRTATATSTQKVYQEPITHTSTASHDNNHNKNTWTPVDKIVKLSPFHSLESSHVKFPASRLDAVLSHVTSALYHSHQCIVQYETTHLAAVCHALRDGVVFGITFFLDGINDKSKPCGGEGTHDTVIFEVQRIAGDSFAFHKYYAQALLRLVVQQRLQQQHQQQAKHRHEQQQQLQHETLSTTSISDLLPDQPNKDHNTNVQMIYEALQIATEMIVGSHNNRHHQMNDGDTMNLGLESLLALTDPTRAGWDTALTVVQMMMGGRTIDSEAVPSTAPSFSLLLETLRYYLVEESNIQALKLWVQVWQIVANTMTTDNGMMMSTVSTKITSLDMIQHLLSLLDCHTNAHSPEQLHQQQSHQRPNPHAVTLALQGLTALCGIDPSLRHVLASSSLPPAATRCRATVTISVPTLVQRVQSTAHYSAMEDASRRLLQTMMVC